MASIDPGRVGASIDARPDAYDPVTNPELFEGVLARRAIAFFIDIVVIMTPVAILALFIFLFGLVTFGLGWLLFWFLHAITIVWAVLYYGLCYSGSTSATLGMRMMEIELRTWYGAPGYFVLGAVHGVLYWVSVSFLTPLVLIVGFLNVRRRLLHDFLLGTVVINSPLRAAALARRGR
jgi:uncharacterized RDD family membrane protein YckC